MTHKTAKKQTIAIKVFFIPVFIIVLLFIVKLLAAGTFSLSDFSQSSGQAAEIDHGWNLLLVNQDNKMPKDWDMELIQLSNGRSVDSRIYPELQQMFDEMRAQGIYPVVASGYRDARKQQELMDKKVESFISQGYSQSEAKKEALKWVASVGYSEHQTGLAVDINADGVNSTGEQVYKWLADNAWQYGFILRYPEGKTNITNTDYEPWHYRYVGKEAAADIYKQGICLEEYIDNLN